MSPTPNFTTINQSHSLTGSRQSLVLQREHAVSRTCGGRAARPRVPPHNAQRTLRYSPPTPLHHQSCSCVSATQVLLLLCVRHSIATGISLVEAMAAGAVVVAHNSGGPRDDIKPPHLCDGVEGCVRLLHAIKKCNTLFRYADAIFAVLSLPAEQQSELSRQARARAQAFGNQKFCDAFYKALVFGKIFEEAAAVAPVAAAPPPA